MSTIPCEEHGGGNEYEERASLEHPRVLYSTTSNNRHKKCSCIYLDPSVTKLFASLTYPASSFTGIEFLFFSA